MNSFAESYPKKRLPKNVCVNLEKKLICIFANQNNYRCAPEGRIEGLLPCQVRTATGDFHRAIILQGVPQYPLTETGRWSFCEWLECRGKFTNCSTFLVLKTDTCFLKSTLSFSVSIFTALHRLYIRIANMIKAEKALLVQLATVQQHNVSLQAKHLFQAS